MSRYRELARGQIAGDSYGMLKLLVSTEDRKLLGVHIFGTNATELVHIGQAVMGCGGTVEYLVDAVFNYPTFAEAYKVAALDVMNKMRALSQFRTWRQQSSSNTVGAASPGPPASARASSATTRVVERRRVRDVFVTPAAVEPADHTGDRRPGDPRRAAGAVDQARRTAATGTRPAPSSVVPGSRSARLRRPTRIR